MVNYVKTITEYIQTGAYNYSDLEGRLDVLFVEGKITQEQRDELLTLAANSAQDSAQIDMVSKLKELEDRIYALEHPVAEDGTHTVAYEHAIYIPGYITKKGEIVRFDYNGDNTYDLLRYDGGRAETSLSPGKIDGWHVVDAQGNILGTYYKGEFTPVE